MVFLIVDTVGNHHRLANHYKTESRAADKNKNSENGNVFNLVKLGRMELVKKINKSRRDTRKRRKVIQLFNVNLLDKVREYAHNTELADKEAARDYKKNSKHFLIRKIKRLVHIAVAVIVSKQSHYDDSHKLDRRTENTRNKKSSERLTAPHKLEAFLHRLRFLGYGNSFLRSDTGKFKEN